ncbi:MAG: hypothetical protein IPK76_04930 [Lewinellaceae bacterium]|jgi:hypothetical protein|nr:hypothetical protein [Lewinellaceae bacterium]
MSPNTHRLYISMLVTIGVLITLLLAYQGFSYYSTSLEERFYHPDHANFKPSGIYGHGLGIVGTLLILIGVFSYIARKRYKSLARLGRLKYWLEFHIFLCSVGPVMVLFHTAFKFGGIVSISFWSMVAVVASGVIGRFIYIQIPRTIEGRELSLSEVQSLKSNVEDILVGSYGLDAAHSGTILESIRVAPRAKGGNLLSGMINKYFEDKKTIRRVKKILRDNHLPQTHVLQISRLIKREISLNNRIERLQTMQKLFKYWHVAHLPFAIIMLIIMVVHVAVTLAFGYRWIF